MKVSCFVACAIMALLLVGHVPAAMSATCSPTELSPCAGSMLMGSAPTAACCGKLNEQKSCLCKYMNDPTLRKYIKPENARMVAQACKVPTPNC